jgi:SAM-dependent methyltransferase
MPPPEQWESFFDAAAILDVLGCSSSAGDVVEFGCGYGTFTIPAARRVSGTVYAIDIDPLMVATTADRAARAGTRNVVAQERDFVVDGCGRAARSAEYVMLFNVLHLDDPVSLLREAYRVLRPQGIVGLMHWKRDAGAPRGPPLEIRPSPEQCQRWAEAAGLKCVRTQELPGSPWHWGMLLERS